MLYHWVCRMCQGYGAGRSQDETTCACFYTQPTLLFFRVQLLHAYSICHTANLSAVRLTQVLAGLHFLHGRCRIIHADIKPENVLLYIHDKNLHRFLLDGAECGQGTDLRLKAPGEHCGFYCKKRDLRGCCQEWNSRVGADSLRKVNVSCNTGTKQHRQLTLLRPLLSLLLQTPYRVAPSYSGHQQKSGLAQRCACRTVKNHRHLSIS